MNGICIESRWEAAAPNFNDRRVLHRNAGGEHVIGAGAIGAIDGALHRVVGVLAHEVAGTGVHVVNVSPGFVATERKLILPAFGALTGGLDVP